MSKVKPTTKEQLVYFLHTHISLGTYDKKFIDNILLDHISTLRPVTTNQNNLLDKITLRYERQLRKEEVDANEMVKLSWNIQPIESSPKYTQAYVDIHGENIEVRSPFKSEFIKEFRSFPSAVWDKEEKVWSHPLHESALKEVLELVEKHYNTPNYSDEIKDIIESFKQFEGARYWNPTLVTSNNFFYIAASNEFINDAIKDLTLNNSTETIARLVYHGVDISKSVIDSIPKEIADDDVFFAIEREPSIERDVDVILNKLSLINPDYVVIRERTAVPKQIADKIRNELVLKGVKVDVIDQRHKPLLEDIKNSKLPIVLGGYSFKTAMNSVFAKAINLVNSNPIEIK